MHSSTKSGNCLVDRARQLIRVHSHRYEELSFGQGSGDIHVSKSRVSCVQFAPALGGVKHEDQTGAHYVSLDRVGEPQRAHPDHRY